MSGALGVSVRRCDARVDARNPSVSALATLVSPHRMVSTRISREQLPPLLASPAVAGYGFRNGVSIRSLSEAEKPDDSSVSKVDPNACGMAGTARSARQNEVDEARSGVILIHNCWLASFSLL